jgi:transposase
MKSVGIDLHKKTITLCVVDHQGAILTTRTMACAEPQKIAAFFAALGDFQAVVEATAGYEWLFQLLEPTARRLVLAHPGKLRIIAQSTRKSDKFDARVLAEFLHLGMIPESYRPTPRQRQHRALVRHRQFLMRERTRLRNKVRRVLSDYNADRRDLFSRRGLEALASAPLSDGDRFIVEQMLEQLRALEGQRRELQVRLRAFAKAGGEREARDRELLRGVPGVGEVTCDVVLAELGDVQRFRSAKQVVAYAGLAPGRRESAGKAKDLGITKAGSGLLRWVLVEASWQVVRRSAHWGGIYERLKRRRGGRRAIVAVARRLLELMTALLRSGQAYREVPPAVGPAEVSCGAFT